MDARTIEELKAGYARQQQGDLRGARVLYGRVLARDPCNEFALNLMGVIALREGDAAAAVRHLEAALAVNATDPETHNNLGLAREALKDLAGAGRAFEASLRLKPAQPVVLMNLGNAHAAQNDQRAAIRCYEASLRLKPDSVECLGNLALALLSDDQLEPAQAAVRAALHRAPSEPGLLTTQGRIRMAMGRYEEALASLETALRADPELVDARIQLSTVCKQLRRECEARAHLDAVLLKEPDNTEAHKCLGVLLEQTGDFEGAAVAFREAIRAAPNHASAYYQLAKLSSVRLTEAELAAVAALLDDPATSRAQRGPLAFAMACELEKARRYPESLAYFTEGNRARSGATYDPAADDAYFHAVKNESPAAAADTRPESLGFTPVFVLGMPRSGTTLTEQILASHSRIRGAGECGALSEMALEATRLTGQPVPGCLSRLSSAQVRTLRSRYGQALRALAGDAEFIVDKTPANFQLIGLIRTLLPESRILYCRRNALDNCLSIFRLPFDESQTYSHDLASLGAYYRNHERLMSLWLTRFEGAILTVEYEQTVEDLAAQAQRMLGFVGVPFEEGVLAFHESERMILTPSAQQVRRPIYASSVGVWKRYGDAIRPLAVALGVAEPGAGAATV